MNIISKRSVVTDAGSGNLIAIGNNEIEDLIIKKWDIAIQGETEVDILIVSIDQIRKMKKGVSYLNNSNLVDDPEDILIVDNPVILDESRPIKSFNINFHTVLVDETDQITIPEGMALVLRTKTSDSQLSITTNIILEYAREEN